MVSMNRNSHPILSSDLVERVLTKLGFSDYPSVDLEGLNNLYAAVSGSIPNDNIQKRIWFAGDQKGPVTGGEPVEFFENWLRHGTAGTCFPNNGGFCSLLLTIGYDARRTAGSICMGGDDEQANHGSVLVQLDGVDYLVDAQLSSFRALSLMPGEPASTGEGIHDLHAKPIDRAFEISFCPGPQRDQPLVFRTDPNYDPVDHHFFLDKYELSVAPERQRSPFNDALFISRHFPDSILIVGRMNKFTIAADDTVTKAELSDEERKKVLIEELGISEEVAYDLPPDKEGGFSLI